MINFALKPTTDDQDVTLHVILASDPNKHICEVSKMRRNLRTIFYCCCQRVRVDPASASQSEACAQRTG